MQEDEQENIPAFENVFREDDEEEEDDAEVCTIKDQKFYKATPLWGGVLMRRCYRYQETLVHKTTSINREIS